MNYDCFAFGKKCLCLSEKICAQEGKTCPFYKTKEQFIADQRKSLARIQGLTGLKRMLIQKYRYTEKDFYDGAR